MNIHPVGITKSNPGPKQKPRRVAGFPFFKIIFKFPAKQNLFLFLED